MGVIKELDNKYLVMKWDDVRNNLSLSQIRELVSIIQYNDKCRELEGKGENNYVVLNLDDKIDLDHWSPILNKITEIQKSHLILLSESKSGNTKRYTRDHSPDYVKDIAPTLINAILKAEGSAP